MSLAVDVGPMRLRTPLVAAAGTVGSVYEWATVADLRPYGAAVAKSVSGTPWPGRPAPRLAPTEFGMLNGIGIQNPGIDAWVADVAPRLSDLDVDVWGSAVGESPDEFAEVAARLGEAGVTAVEVNLSCPNLEDGGMFALDPVASSTVVEAVRAATDVPVGAKLSPNSERIGEIAAACAEAGADFAVVANTVWGAAIDIEHRRPVLTGRIGGYSGIPVKPIAMRCVLEVRARVPDLPVVACGGVRTGEDVVEYLVAGAAAVEAGTVHFAEPDAGRRIVRELEGWMEAHGVADVADLVGTMVSW
ncbi:MAG: dihydroorotate dehydrogenase [Acidimicrobiia bacterium]|nr:dihydroorotate dehydrogenase [Acidimicrobiia bacterium]